MIYGEGSSEMSFHHCYGSAGGDGNMHGGAEIGL